MIIENNEVLAFVCFFFRVFCLFRSRTFQDLRDPTIQGPSDPRFFRLGWSRL